MSDVFISDLLTFSQFFFAYGFTLPNLEAMDSTLHVITVAALISFQNCDWSVLEKSTRQASLEVLGTWLHLHIPT